MFFLLIIKYIQKMAIIMQIKLLNADVDYFFKRTT